MNENSTQFVVEENQVEESKPYVTFPNAPDDIIDLTPDDDVIRNIIAFSGENIQSEIQKEMDCCFSWIGDFAKPITFVKQEDGENDDVSLKNKLDIGLGSAAQSDPQKDGETDDVSSENKLDIGLGLAAQNFNAVFGHWRFEVTKEDDRIVRFNGKKLKMPRKLYNLLLDYNTNRLYLSDYFDAKFVLISVSSFILSSELRNGGTIAFDDIRLIFARELFRHRVKNDEKRMSWFAKHIIKINEWLKCM